MNSDSRATIPVPRTIHPHWGLSVQSQNTQDTSRVCHSTWQLSFQFPGPAQGSLNLFHISIITSLCLMYFHGARANQITFLIPNTLPLFPTGTVFIHFRTFHLMPCFKAHWTATGQKSVYKIALHAKINMLAITISLLNQGNPAEIFTEASRPPPYWRPSQQLFLSPEARPPPSMLRAPLPSHRHKALAAKDA